jgi:elongation factor G
MVFPEPVISQAVEPKTKADQEKMGIALGRLAPKTRRSACAPTKSRPDHHLGHGRAAPGNHRRPHEARVRRGSQRRQAAGGLPRDHPQDVSDVEGKFVRQSGGKGQYGHVVLKIEPQEPGKGFEFVDAIKGGVVPREFIPRSRRASKTPCPTACWPATRWWT